VRVTGDHPVSIAWRTWSGLAVRCEAGSRGWVVRWKVWVAVVLLVAGCGASPSRADFKRTADSEEVARGREAAARVAGERVAALRAAMPWAQWSESSVDHVCGSETTSALFAPIPDYLVCFSVFTQYVAFDTDLAEEIRAFDAAAVGAGWGDSVQPVDIPIQYYRDYRGRPEGSRTYDASNLPEITYSDAGSTLFTCGGSGPSMMLRQRWLEAGQPLPVDERQSTTAGLSLDHPPVFEEHDPLEHERVKTAALQQHRYLAVVTVMAQCVYDLQD
jgi:hypothetical protein